MFLSYNILSFLTYVKRPTTFLARLIIVFSSQQAYFLPVTSEPSPESGQ